MLNGSFIQGRILFEPIAGSKIPPATGIDITPIPVDRELSPPDGFATASIRSDGHFGIEGISGPRRFDVASIPEGWMLKTIRAGGVEVVDRPLSFGAVQESLLDVEIVLTDRLNEVAGIVRDERSRPRSDMPVIVFSIDRSDWYWKSRFLRRTRSNGEGEFSIRGLPTGSYFVATAAEIPNEGADAWQESAFLETLISHASTLIVGEGQRVTTMIGSPH
jgi:hypothetical protein